MAGPQATHTADIVGAAMGQLRSIERALADLRKKHGTNPTASLARMIRQLEAEIAARTAPPVPVENGEYPDDTGKEASSLAYDQRPLGSTRRSGNRRRAEASSGRSSS